ncbi:hypothetical protein BV898_11238 [Hypsibius exemplaris]|uniref:Uncharacterized protein n=1 Tax=Hypsibius exemplaris TaxID=2072580 RepID=A0A1W0WH36_HYPEX|nr:hypothetical protein BV898_11238 [Hypsibius exemplaris]
MSGGNGALPFHGPAFEAAVKECNGIYAGLFNFTITFLTAATVEEMNENFAGNISRWHFDPRRSSDIDAIISPVYRTDTNGIRKIYYEFWGERSSESWTKFWKESHSRGVMFVTGVCSRGKTAIRFVKPGAKINSEYYIQHVLKPLFKSDIRKLFPGKLINKIVFHHDSAPAQSSGITQEWL